MNTKTILLIGVGFTILCTALVLFGVFNHTEAGLARPEMAWAKERFPLTVQTTSYQTNRGAKEEARKVTISAIDQVNLRLGFRALKYDAHGVTDITVTIGVPQNITLDAPASFELMVLKESGGYYRLNANRNRLWKSCQIQTSNTGTQDILHAVLKHELGHCLGLDHDDFSSSIMYDMQSEWESGMPPTFTDSDRDLLRDLYAP